MTLRLLTSRPQPLHAEKDLRELIRIWRAQDKEGQKVLIAHARAVAEVSGKGVGERRA